MIKQLSFFRTAPDITRTTLITRAEAVARSLAAQGHGETSRNYVRPGGDVAAGHIEGTAPPLVFDFVCSLRGDSPAFRFPDGPEPIGTYAVEEHRSPDAELGAGGVLPRDAGAVKMICVIKRRPGMARDAFIEYYETGHSRLAAQHLPMIAGYHRSYVLPGETGGTDVAPQFDVMTEMWFRSQEDFDAMAAALQDPTLGAMFAQDEEKLFDRNNIQMFLVEERAGPITETAW